jgi:hypothetical protein
VWATSNGAFTTEGGSDAGLLVAFAPVAQSVATVTTSGNQQWRRP